MPCASGVAGHNLFDIAYTWLLAQARGVADPDSADPLVEYEMLLGMATGQAEAVRKDVGRLLLYTPVVNPAEFDVAIAYLVRRLEENASPENFMSAVFELASNPTLLTRERERFERSLAALATDEPAFVPAPPPRAGPHRCSAGRHDDRFREPGRHRSRHRREPCLGGVRSSAARSDRTLGLDTIRDRQGRDGCRTRRHLRRCDRGRREMGRPARR